MNKNKLYFYLFNWFSFYLYWILCIWGASKNEFYLGPIVGSLFIIIHILIIDNRLKEIKYIIICILSGFILQSIFYYLNILEYKGSIMFGKFLIVPPWILILWAGLGSTIFHSFNWIINKKVLGTVLAAICFPIIFYSADKWNAMILNYEINSFIIICLLSALNFYILIKIAFFMNRHE